MIKRRDFVGAAGAVVATCFLPAFVRPEFAYAQDSSAAGSTGLAPPPRDGLGANHNYWVYNGGDPIKDLSVEIDFTEDFVAEAGFSIQLNGWSPANARCT
jgi:hypothetical protein